MAKAQKAVARSVISFQEEDDSESDTSDKGEEEDLLPLVGESLHTQIVRPEQNFEVGDENEASSRWSYYMDSEKQGIIYQVKPYGYGWIYHPNFKDLLFFHAKQIVPPVDSLNSIEIYSVVSFAVGKSERGPRAMNIKTVVCYFLNFILLVVRRLHENCVPVLHIDQINASRELCTFQFAILLQCLDSQFSVTFSTNEVLSDTEI